MHGITRTGGQASTTSPPPEATVNEVMTIIVITVISGLTVRILRRRTDRGGPYEDFGFEIPEIGGGVQGFGSLTPGDAEASARDFIEWHNQRP